PAAWRDTAPLSGYAGAAGDGAVGKPQGRAVRDRRRPTQDKTWHSARAFAIDRRRDTVRIGHFGGRRARLRNAGAVWNHTQFFGDCGRRKTTIVPNPTRACFARWSRAGHR